jgi:dolichol-phosphate mannosyltransferase
VKVSIITAFLNEADNLPEFRQRVLAVGEQLDAELEVLLVDDHSTDASREIALQWGADDSRVSYIRLSHNCGSHAAFSAGLAHCTGDCAILLAADLQDPPEVIPQILTKWRSGYDVVWAAREFREGESWRTQLFSRSYYWLMRRLALPDMPARGADFVLMDQKVIRAYNAIPEKNTSFLAMILWMGFRQTSIEYVKQARAAGKSKWTLSKKIKLLIDSMVSFSYAPIRLMSCLGVLMSLCGFIYALVVLVGRLTGWVSAGTGFAALMVVLLVGQGSIMLMLGVLGEYLWRAFDEGRGRPRYIIEERRTSNAIERQPADRAVNEVSTARSADATPEK